eukprot:6063188-Amphidinium_carterae.2
MSAFTPYHSELVRKCLTTMTVPTVLLTCAGLESKQNNSPLQDMQHEECNPPRHTCGMSVEQVFDSEGGIVASHVEIYGIPQGNIK